MKRKLLSLAVALLCSVGLFAETDVTATYLTNPDFSDDGTGWTGTGSNKAQAFIIASNTTFKKGSDDKNAEMWIYQDQQLGSGDLNQTLSNVTAGIYRLSAKVRSDIKFYLYATAAGESEQHQYSETAIDVKEVSLIFVVKKTSNVTIGLKHSGVSINTHNWIAVDDFKLYYEGAIGSSVDVTNQIANWHFTGCENNDFPGWTISAPNGGNTWKNGDTRVEYWTGHAANGNFDYYQTITGLPTGKYSLSASMWNSTNNEAEASFGDGGTCGVYGTSSNGTQFKGVTVDSDNSNLNTYTTDKIIVTDGNLRVGVKNNTTMTARWFGVDWIKLNYDPYISVVAPDFTSGSEMAAGQWYKFTVDATGDYGFDVVDGVILTSNGSQALSEATGDALTQTVALSTGTTYYIKSTTAQTVTKSGKFTYTIGTATSDKSYIQEGNTVTISYASMTTTNTYTSEIDTEISGVTFGGNTISVSRTSKGFTFTVPTVTAGTDYTLSIPADVIGYQAPGSGKNEAQNITLKTPAVFDGVYYLKNVNTGTYLSRSGNYGTQAILDNKGLAINFTTDASNNTQLKYIDNQLYFGFDGPCFGDASGENARNFNITSVTGGFQFLNTSNSKYLAASGAAAVANAEVGDASNVWAIESTSAHIANYTANANAQVVTAVSNIPALSSITTKAALETELAANYANNNIVITGAKGEKYQEYAGSSIELSENTYYSETISGLHPGLYKLTVRAFQRAAWNDWIASADGARGTIYLYANDAKTQLKSVMEYSSNSAYTTGNYPDYEYDGKHYPNSLGSAYEALENLDFSNDVYVYVPADESSETGTLEIGIKNPTRQGNNVNNGTWVVYDNWTLTYYGAPASSSEKSALASAIATAEAKTIGFEEGEYAPYNNVDALSALKAANLINDAANPTSVAVVDATTALSGATWTANVAEVNAFYDGNFTIQEEHTTGPTALAGWSNPEGIRQLIKNTENYQGLTSASGKAAVFAWGNTNMIYGGTEGYTMPLNAHTIYELSFKTCGWSDGDMGYVSVSLKNAKAEGLGDTHSVTATKRITESEPWDEFRILFVTGEAGNYTFGMWTSKHTTFTDLQLVKAASQTLTLPSATQYAAGTYPAVELGRTFTTTNWATVCVPFAFDDSNFEVKELSDITVTGDHISIKLDDASTIVAGKPYLVKATAADAKIAATDVAMPGASVQNTSIEEGDYTVTYNGTYEGTSLNGTDNSNAWVVSQNQLWNVDSNVTVGAYRAYFTVTGGTSVKALVFGDEETGINNLNVDDDLNKNEVIYNLAGQRVQKAVKGLYIKNGKKVVIK